MRKKFEGSVVTWFTKNLKTYVTVVWERGGRPWDGEARLHTADGEQHVLYVHEVDIGDEQPQLVLAVGYMSPGVDHLAPGLKVTGA